MTSTIPEKLVKKLQMARANAMVLPKNSLQIPPVIFLEALDELIDAVVATYKTRETSPASSDGPSTDPPELVVVTEEPELPFGSDTDIQGTPV
jgi:hypothetical protein